MTLYLADCILNVEEMVHIPLMGKKVSKQLITDREMPCNKVLMV